MIFLVDVVCIVRIHSYTIVRVVYIRYIRETLTFKLHFNYKREIWLPNQIVIGLLGKVFLYFFSSTFLF